MKKFMLFLGVLLFGVTSVNTAQVGQIWEPPIVPSIYKEKQNIPLEEHLETVAPVIDPNELECMAKNIYFEAAIESTAGKIAVAQVTMNRVRSRHYPDSICKVVYQGKHHSNGFPVRDRCQFSWYCDGKVDDVANKRAYKESDKIAFLAIESYNAIKTKGLDITEGARYYHTYAVSPKWSKTFPKGGRIGDHIFYR